MSKIAKLDYKSVKYKSKQATKNYYSECSKEALFGVQDLISINQKKKKRLKERRKKEQKMKCN